MTIKVALIADWFAPRRGGIENQLLGLASGLTSAGVDVRVITSMPGPDNIGGIAVTRLDCLRLPSFPLAVSPRLVGIVRTALIHARPDVVHIHPSIVAPTCLAGFIAARSLGLPVVFTFHSWMVNLPRFLRIADRIWRWTQPPVRITGVGSHIAAQLNTIRPGLDAQILPNGFDYGFWSEQSAPKPDTRDFTIATAIRFDPKKRPLVLPGLLAEVGRSAEGRNVNLIAAGQGRLTDAATGLAAKLGVAEEFRIEGWLDREGLRSLYRRSDLFVLPSTTESFGLAALEARAAGLPIVARAGTGVEDYIKDGVDGFLCASDAEMTRAVSRLLHDGDLLARLSGPRPDLMRYDWSQAIARHLEIYRDLAGQSEAAPVA